MNPSPCPRCRPLLRARLVAVSLVPLIGLLNQTANAGSGSWLNTGTTDANWSTSSNWTGGTVPGATSGTANGDTATFNSAVGTYGTSGTPIVIDFGRNLKSIIFDLAAAGAYTIGTTGGNALNLTSGGSITMNSAVANTETVNAPLSIQGSSYSFSNNAASSSALLNIGGAVGGTSGTLALTLSGTNTGNNTVSGDISNGGATYVTMNKSGAGTWILSGTDVFSNAQTYQSALAVNAGTLNVQGNLTLTKGSATISNGATLQISGANGYVSGTSAITVASGGTLMVDDRGAGAASTSRVTNTVTLNNGSLLSYLGSDQAATDTADNMGVISLSSGIALLTVDFTGTNTAQLTASSLSRSSGTGGILFINGTNLGANTSGSGEFLLGSVPTVVGTTTATNGINVGAQDTKIALFAVGESGAATGQNGTATGTANTFLTYNGLTGYRPLNPTDEFTNDAISAGNNTYLATGTTTASATAAINSLVVNGGDLSIESGTTLTDTSGMLLFAANGGINGAGTFALGGSSNQEGVVVVNAGVSATIGSVFSTGTTGLTTYGAGTLTLGGENSYTGKTVVNAGSTLVIGNNSALGLSSITAAGGTIQGDGQARTISNSLIGTTTGMTIGGSSDLTFTGGGTVGTPAYANTTYANTAINIINTGTTTFSGVFSINNSSSGSNNGASILAFGSSANVVISGAIQDNNSGNVATPSTGLGNLVFKGVGANFTISGNNGYGTGKTTQISPSSGYNTVTVGGPGGSGATITPFGATNLYTNTNTTLFLVAETDGQILGNGFTGGGSGMGYGFAGANSMTLGGTWVASANSSFTNLATGTLTFDNSISGKSFSLLGSGNTILDSNATLAAGAYDLIATQSGTLTLASANNMTGNTTLSGGTVVLDYGAGSAGGGTNRLTQRDAVASSAAALSLGGVDLQLSGGAYAQTLGTPTSGANGTTLTSGQSKISQTNSGASTIALGAITRNAGSAIDFQAGVASTTTANASGILGGYATVGTGDWATGGGTIAALGSYDSFATPGTDQNILQADGGSVAASTIVNSLKITTSADSQSLAIASGQILGLTSGGLLFTGANDYSITGGTLRPTVSSGDFIVQQYGSGVLTIDSVLASSAGGGTSTLTKAGTGTLVLTGTNTYTGTTYLDGGVLQIGAAANIGTGGVAFNGGTLETTATISTNKAVSLGTNGGTFQVDTGTLTLSGVVSGIAYGGLAKTGTGTLVLSGTNTFTAPVTVNDGTLQLGNAAALGASATGSNRSTAPVLVNGGTLDINGQTANLGTVTLQSGAIADTAGTGTLAAYSFNLQSGTVGAQMTDLTISGNTSNSINLYKTTGGTVTLSGANTYTGSTMVSGGKLSVASTGTINTSGGVFIGAGEFNYNSATALSAPVNFTSTGGKLSGGGTISSAVTVTSGNTLAPGNSPGLMTFGSSLTLDPGSTTLMEVGGNTTAGTDYDKVAVTGQISFGGTLTITAYDLGGGTYDIAQAATLDLFGFGSQTGNFTSVTVVGTTLTYDSGTSVWSATNVNGFDYNLALSTGDLIISAAAIPEPSTYALMVGAALLGFALRRPRRLRA